MTTLSGRRARTVSAAGALVIALLVLLFGNPVFVEWVARHHRGTTAEDYLLNVLTFPSWSFVPDSQHSEAWRAWLARDLRAVLVIVFVVALLSFGSEALLSRGTSGLGGFVFGWGATMLGAAVAGFLASLILLGTDNGHWLVGALATAAAGATYGLFYGWLVGAASMGARRG